MGFAGGDVMTNIFSLILAFIIIKSSETEQADKNVKGEGLTRCDAASHSSKQNSLIIIIESVHLIEANKFC